MGRPEPCVLFSQTFVHPQLDEYVDEVIFAESIVITACEFIEHNASSASSVVTLVGATSPPSFALEVFVQSEGEPRFRRLCLPFLYSHSSSNVLEVEAVVTNHLVVRGSYRSLTLVVYGNTAEDLGQFNIEFDLDSSLANLVCSPSEGKLEDLPPALHSKKFTLEESILPPKLLCLPIAEPQTSFQMEEFLQLIIRIFGASGSGDAIQKVVHTVVSAVSSYVSNDLGCAAITWDRSKGAHSKPCGDDIVDIYTEAKNELEELYKTLQHEASSLQDDLLEEGVAIKSEADLSIAPAEALPDIFSWYHILITSCPNDRESLSQNKNMIFGLSIALLICSGRETCFHFVNGGGMEQLVHVFFPETHKSTAVILMLLGVIERATRHAIGCEGFLGWWPREDEIVPVGSSEGYSQMLKLLVQKQRHDVASLATYLLHRLHFYETASRYESAVLSLLAGLSDFPKVVDGSLKMLDGAKLQLKKLAKLLNSRGPVKDPSPVASATRSLILGQTEGILSYKATINLIASSNCHFSEFDIDPHLLSLLKERGFLPLSAALLSSSTLRAEKGRTLDLFVDIASSVEATLLSLLFCRSGLVFLLLQPEVAAALVQSLKGVEDMNVEDCVPLRYASVLINKGFFCRPQDIGMIAELHLRVVNAVDRLLTSTSQSEELLWVLWELCGLSRSDSGRQALLALGHFPEAVSVLMEALRSAKELEPASSTNSGSSPLNLAIFHSAAELFEVIVTDSTASSLGSWIEHSVELHKALHSSSPGSNWKDAPTRLLEWIDAGVVYQKNGAIGLLRYAAVLASGGDAHLTSTSTLVSDSMDVENVVGDSASGSDIQVVENLLGKLVSDKYFDGVTLRDSSIAQLTTTFRILSFISENSSVAAALYEEGAMTLIYVVLVNLKSMLERSSNTYDYLVDEGAECNSMSELLLERGREQSLVDLMIPCLLLLNTLLHKLQEAKEQYRNTKLQNALLRLHREVSPKLAACAADLSSPYPGSALNLGAVCHLLVSALACWPVFGWAPGLFHCLLESVQATSSLSLGPKEACSLLCLLGDLFPEEGIWLWKHGMPSMSALKTLAISTVLGPQKERSIDWYLEHGHVATLLSRLTPLLDKIAQIVLHFAFTALVVIQDMLRVFIIRIAYQKPDSAAILLRPIISWINNHVSETSSLTDTDVFKVYRLLDFLASLLEHPLAKTLLLKEGAVGVLMKALEKCFSSFGSDGLVDTETRASNSSITLLSWCLPVFKSVTLICEVRTSLQQSDVYDNSRKLSVEDCSLILHHLLKLCQVLPAGKELLASLIAFKEVASCDEGKRAFASISIHLQSPRIDEFELERGLDGVINTSDGKRSPPLLCCWKNICRSINDGESLSAYAIEAIGAMSMGALSFCMEGKSFNLDRLAVLKGLFGLSPNVDETEQYPEESLKEFDELIDLLEVRIVDSQPMFTSDMQTNLSQVKEMAKSLLQLLQKPSGSIRVDDITILSTDILDQFSFTSKTMRVIFKEDSYGKTEELFSFNGLADKFSWDCPDSIRDGSPMSAKRKLASMDLLPNRRPRTENTGGEVTGANVFARGLVPPIIPSLPIRRDSFRQRKPNTSRPPSMHVDDYVARERNIDGGSISGSNNIIITPGQRGVTGGRPPSIHVDEFMARERGRQASVPMVGGEVTAAQARSVPPENDTGTSDNADRSSHLKEDLDDDLNIVFDVEEPEPDDKLPFPQPDDNLQPPPAVVEGGSPRSIVEETENNANSVVEENNVQSEFSSRRSSSNPEPLCREGSISSERKFVIPKSEDAAKQATPAKASNGFDSTAPNYSGYPPFYKGPSNFYQRGSPQHAPNVPTGSQGPYNQKHVPNQPPLPPTPPPPNVKSEGVQNYRQPPLPPGFPSKAFETSGGSNTQPVYNYGTGSHPSSVESLNVNDQHQSDYASTFNSSSATFLPNPQAMKYSPSSGMVRPPPPLPPTPPPSSVVKSSTSQSQQGYNLTSYSPPQLVPPMLNSRPTVSLFSSPTIHSVQPRLQLQPLQPPQPPHPHPQHLRPSIQMHQQSHISPIHVYYSPQQQQQQQPQVDISQSQALQQQQGNTSAPQQQQDDEMSLQQYFSSPEAIQSLLGDRDKLCQLLEHNPKLMQMLQDRLGQM
ncbi:hypothetical protein ACHQM5_019815 [Ranunculus cassubicifolius]